jgi:NAD+ diphosphatase
MLPFAAPEAYVAGFNAPAGLPQAALWFMFRGTELLVAEIDAKLPAHPDAVGLASLRSQYLGTLADVHCFSCEVTADTAPPPGWAFSGLRQLFGRLEDSRFALAGRALQIVDWDRTHQYCGRCGGPTQVSPTERSRVCPVCGLTAYPRLAPAVMALVRRGRQILLARSPRFPEGMYSALAGFVEPGETLEQCLEREVFEEVGIRVGNVRYFASQPWPFPHSLMIAFVADHAAGEIAVDGDEIEAAEWFDVALLPRLPAKISIARCLIDAVVGEMLASQSKSLVSARQVR